MDQRWYTTIAGTGAEESQYGRTKYSGMCVMGSETDGGTALEKSVQGLQHKSLLQIPVRGHHPPAQITAPEILWVPVVSARSPHTLSTLFLAACSPGCALHPARPALSLAAVVARCVPACRITGRRAGRAVPAPALACAARGSPRARPRSSLDPHVGAAHNPRLGSRCQQGSRALARSQLSLLNRRRGGYEPYASKTLATQCNTKSQSVKIARRRPPRE